MSLSQYKTEDILKELRTRAVNGSQVRVYVKLPSIPANALINNPTGKTFYSENIYLTPRPESMLKRHPFIEVELKVAEMDKGSGARNRLAISLENCLTYGAGWSTLETRLIDVTDEDNRDILDGKAAAAVFEIDGQTVSIYFY